jgi:hypothetical protein
MNKMTAMTLTALVACALPSQAHAAETERDEGVSGYFRERVPAPVNALEIGTEIGFAQGFGRLNAARPFSAGAGPGSAAGVSVGYRIDPRFSIAAEGQYSQFARPLTSPEGSQVRGVTTGVNLTYHLQPTMRLDPWVSYGVGYRGIGESQPGTASAMSHAIELGKLRAGIDLRTTPSIAVGPVIGADLDYFVAGRAPGGAAGGAETETLSARRLSTFVFAGVQGRFDVTGTHTTSASTTAGR